MPVKTEKRKNKYRVVEVATGEVAKNASGTAIDGGGYSSKERQRDRMKRWWSTRKELGCPN